MSSPSDVDVRGRAVVWQAGTLDDDVGRSGWRRTLRRIAALGLASVLAAALLVVVATWSVISPVGASPTTPLWIAPPNVHRPASVHPSTPASTPSNTPSRMASPTPVVAEKSVDRLTTDRRHDRVDDSGSKKTDTADSSGRTLDHSGTSGKSSKSSKSSKSGRSGGSDGSGRSGGSDGSGRSGGSDDSGHSGRSDGHGG